MLLRCSLPFSQHARGTYTVIAVASLLNMLTDELKEGEGEEALSSGRTLTSAGVFSAVFQQC